MESYQVLLTSNLPSHEDVKKSACILAGQTEMGLEYEDILLILIHSGLPLHSYTAIRVQAIITYYLRYLIAFQLIPSVSVTFLHAALFNNILKIYLCTLLILVQNLKSFHCPKPRIEILGLNQVFQYPDKILLFINTTQYFKGPTFQANLIIMK